MKTKALLLTTIVATSAGCVVMPTIRQISDWSTIDAGPPPDYATAQARVEEVMRETLKDPYSAQFRHWSPLHKSLYSFAESAPLEPLWQICVQMNAKNSYGGYVGFKTYFIKLRDGEPVMDAYGYSESSTGCQAAMDDPKRLHGSTEKLPRYVDADEMPAPAVVQDPAPQRRLGAY